MVFAEVLPYDARDGSRNINDHWKPANRAQVAAAVLHAPCRVIISDLAKCDFKLTYNHKDFKYKYSG